MFCDFGYVIVSRHDWILRRKRMRHVVFLAAITCPPALVSVRARRVFLTLVLTGLRRFELQGLRWRHVNLVDGTLRVDVSKSEEGERLISLPPCSSTR